MRQETPTLMAQTQVLDPAHPFSRVGSGDLPGRHPEQEQYDALKSLLLERLTLISQRQEEFLRISESFSKQERLQLAEAARLSLVDEIALLRKSIKVFAREAELVREGAPYPSDLAKTLDMLGLSCGRMASLLRVQVILQGPQNDGLIDDLLALMGTYVDKLAGPEAGSDD
ncbi:MAG: hypothetical protein M0P11_03090 [Anaerolineaceae bacterium]|nr:hypothetical protein [Anaerolineaceae bacterium]